MKRHQVGSLVVMWLTVGAAPAIADPPPRPLTTATWNLEWFFDEYRGDNYSKLAKEQSAPDRSQWDWKRDRVAEGIAQMKPTILALQEVENQRVLFYLTRRLKSAHQLVYRDAFIQGTDYYTEQDVGLLFHGGLVQFCRRRQSSEMRDSKKYYGVQKHLFARFEWNTHDGVESLMVVTVHFRAMPRAATLRQRQARLIRYWIHDAVRAGQNVIVLGDFNTEEPFRETTPTSEMGILRGLDTTTPTDDLVDLDQYLKPADRGTHLLPGKQFDRILVSRSLMADEPGRVDLVFKSIALRRDVVVRGQQQDKDHWDKFYKIPEKERDTSDHYPLIATFEFR